MDKKAILDNVDKLMVMYKNGELGGEVMPKDANPNFEKDSLENYIFHFTNGIKLSKKFLYIMGKRFKNI